MAIPGGLSKGFLNILGKEEKNRYIHYYKRNIRERIERNSAKKREKRERQTEESEK